MGKRTVVTRKTRKRKSTSAPKAAPSENLQFMIVALSAAAAGLDVATKTVQLSVAAYEKTRSDVAAMMESLKMIIESAKREAGLSKELVTQLESAAAKFSVVQTDADAYLGRVSSVLEETFAKFTDSMAKALDKARINTDDSLSNAVGMLRATIEDLDEGLDRISTRK